MNEYSFIMNVCLQTVFIAWSPFRPISETRLDNILTTRKFSRLKMYETIETAFALSFINFKTSYSLRLKGCLLF